MKLTFRAKHRQNIDILQYVQYVNFALIFRFDVKVVTKYRIKLIEC